MGTGPCRQLTQTVLKLRITGLKPRLAVFRPHLAAEKRARKTCSPNPVGRSVIAAGMRRGCAGVTMGLPKGRNIENQIRRLGFRVQARMPRGAFDSSSRTNPGSALLRLALRRTVTIPLCVKDLSH